MIQVILAGGSGKRLWPLSTREEPKQIIPIFNGISLFEKTIIQNNIDSKIVITNERIFPSLKSISPNSKFLIEKEPLGTNMSIAFIAIMSDPEEMLVITPSDHIIKNTTNYNHSISLAIRKAKKQLVLIGISPSYPETGYGYISLRNNKVVAFHEKPNLETATSYMNSNYLWNSGIVVVKASILLTLFSTYDKVSLANAREILSQSTLKSGNIYLKNKDPYLESFDCSILEKAKDISVISACNLGWKDMGSIDSLSSEIPSSPFKEVNSSNNYCFTSKDKNILFLDIDNVSVIETEDSILISNRGSSQQIKEIELPDSWYETNKTNRPWGQYKVIKSESNYKVKELIVNPGERISLQYHKHRSEHWILVKGKIEAQINEKIINLSENESLYIPANITHRLSNKSDQTALLIEVQTGTYLEEDDIIRIEDDYERP